MTDILSQENCMLVSKWWLEIWDKVDHLRVRGDQPVSGEDTQPQDSEWNFAESPEPPPPPPLETSQRPNTPTSSSGARPINHCYPQRRQAPNRYMWDCYFCKFLILLLCVMCCVLYYWSLTRVFVGEECGVCNIMSVLCHCLCILYCAWAFVH